MPCRSKKQIKLKGVGPLRIIEDFLQGPYAQVFIWRSKGSKHIRIAVEYHQKQVKLLDKDFEYYSLRDFESSSEPSDIYIPKIIVHYFEEDVQIIAQDCEKKLYMMVLNQIEKWKVQKEPSSSTIEDLEVMPIDDPSEELQQWHKSFNGAMNLIENNIIEKIVISRTKQFSHNIKDKKQILHWAPIAKNVEDQSQYFILIKRKNGNLHYSMTPETLLAKQDQNIFIDALAGTRKVSQNTIENKQIIEELLNNEKENHEHRLVEKYIETVLDSIDIKWSQSKSKSVKVLKYIQHLHSQYEAQVNLEQWEDLKKCFHPTPAVGARPYRYWTKISTLENRKRGLYAGLIGWHGPRCEDISVNLRCIDIHKDKLMIHAGCGIVALSDSKKEFIETERKMFNYTQHLKISSLEAESWPDKSL